MSAQLLYDTMIQNKPFLCFTRHAYSKTCVRQPPLKLTFVAGGKVVVL